MKKLLFLMLFLAVPLYADAKKYSYEDPRLNTEIDSIYKDLLYIRAVNVTASTGTFTNLNVSSVTITGSVSGLPTASPTNILDNGGFEIWQRGTGFTTPANLAYLADRWVMQVDGTPTFTVGREATTIDSGIYSLKLDVTVIAGSPSIIGIRQQIENYAEYWGKTLTVRVRVKCSVAGKIVVQIVDSGGTVTSSVNSGTGWETLTVSKTVDTSATSLGVRIGMNTVTPVVATTYIDSEILAIGSSVASFVPTNPAVDMGRCERLFQVIGRSNNQHILSGHVTSTTAAGFEIRFPVTMRTSPTCTVNNPTHFEVRTAAGASNTLSALSVDDSDIDHIRVSATAGTANLVAGDSTMLTTVNAFSDGSIYCSSDL